MDLIVTHGSRVLPAESPWYGLSYRTLLQRKRQLVEIEPLGLPPDSAVKGELHAYVNAGRWMVECPDCFTAVLIDEDDLLFYCPGCGTDDQWKRVTMPSERDEIERLLLLRPGWRENSPNRNWLPHETVEDLRQQNIQNGVSV